jgi:hypothetical protein
MSAKVLQRGRAVKVIRSLVVSVGIAERRAIKREGW